MPIRILLCDDHPVFRRGLRALLEEFDDLAVVGEAADGEQALALAATAAPHVVVMDLHLPGINGVEATRRVVARDPDAAVLVLTMFEDDRYLGAALRAGARGYLVKGAEHDEILRGIRAVARGEVMLGRAVSPMLTDAFAAPGPPSAFPQLSAREEEILALVSGGLSNQEIAARLFLSPKTVRNNVSGILAKLGVDTRAAAIAKARDAGVGAPDQAPVGERPGDHEGPPPGR